VSVEETLTVRRGEITNHDGRTERVHQMTPIWVEYESRLDTACDTSKGGSDNDLDESGSLHL